MNPGGQILVLNAGSSSLKLGLFDATTQEQLAEKHVSWTVNEAVGQAAALRDLLSDLQLKGIAAVGHRVVHGGTRYTRAIRIDAAVSAEIEALASWRRSTIARRWMVSRPSLGCFPAFRKSRSSTRPYASLPPHAFLYALPYRWYERWGCAASAHGLSHAYCAGRAAELLGGRSRR